jgi:four helix bundle protein
MKGRSFEELECWQAARALRIHVARHIVPQLPRNEIYRLGDQLLRAARSTTANLAEGHGRFHYQDNSKFCRNARGSCCEALDHLITAVDEGLLPAAALAEARPQIDTAMRLINGYIGYLTRAAAKAAGNPASSH